MISLEDCLKIGKAFGYDDKTIISHYICENNLEEEYLELIPVIASNALKNLRSTIGEHEWLAFPAENFYHDCYNKKMKPETAALLDQAVRYTILEKDLTRIVKELKGKTENLETPNPYYVPALKKLLKMGVIFKDSESYKNLYEE